MPTNTSSRRTRSRRRPSSADAYLASLDAERRATLQRLRETILAIVPRAEECISYGMPAFRVDGVVVAGFLATARGCSYFPFSGATLGALAPELSRYERTRSALHFPAGRPLPVTLVRKLVRTRLAERPQRGPRRGGHRSPARSRPSARR